MWKDPIIDDLHKIREDYAREFGFEVDGIFQDIERRQEQSDQEHVSFPPRKPESVNDAA